MSAAPSEKHVKSVRAAKLKLFWVEAHFFLSLLLHLHLFHITNKITTFTLSQQKSIHF